MKYTALETQIVQNWQNGLPDAHGHPPERAVSDGQGNPCRHCLNDIPKGAPMLILAHRPFPTLHPYAESGPIFVCAEPCQRAAPNIHPAILTTSPDYLVKGYAQNDRIIYGTGAIVPTQDFENHCEILLKYPQVAYLHVRSARNNCYQLRLDR